METISQFTIPVYEYLTSLNWTFIITMYMLVYILHVRLNLFKPLNDTWSAAIVATLLAFAWWKIGDGDILRLFQSVVSGIFIHALMLRKIQKWIDNKISNWK